MAGESEKITLLLKVSSEQRDAIAKLFEDENWNFEEFVMTESEGDGAENFVRTYRIDHSQDPEHTECQHCLCRPCITDESNRQMWWEPEPVPPSRNNHALRKERYKYFWTMLFHRGVFLDERYQNRKLEAMRQDPRLRNQVCHRRDLLPKCVIELVREWFPNLPGVPYMGHRWE
ncbi:hypothetical protein FSP39_009076 [Pinctada imbricata]|uniref:Uncharacterized protein n=1 Tax=Pinctada imbricata TaxID=66713 RepID=A0AA89CDW0_PINIB|nr:hypothetical protein FSP39_021707 [Pinctada imbricata]KAK3108491.1 hypothetical protein FSP39_009076 [Pinctada imbricata]